MHCKFGGRAGHKNIVELAAAAIAKKHGPSVISTTRNASRESLLRSSGADDVVIDTGSIAEGVRDKYHEGVDKVLELIGTASLLDSLRCVKEGGVVCMTGIVGNKWSFDNFARMDAVPTAGCGSQLDVSASVLRALRLHVKFRQTESSRPKLGCSRALALGATNSSSIR